MTIDMEIDESTVRKIILEYLHEKLGFTTIQKDDITIEVKSKQNYRSEWEQAAFKAKIHKIVL